MFKYIILCFILLDNTIAQKVCSLCDGYAIKSITKTSVPIVAYFAFILAGISAASWFSIICYYSCHKEKKN